jgi:hypothetical protein
MMEALLAATIDRFGTIASRMAFELTSILTRLRSPR